jgi:hypothetical protein
MEPAINDTTPSPLPARETFDSSLFSQPPEAAGPETSSSAASSMGTQLSTPPSPTPKAIDMDRFGEHVPAEDSAFFHRHLRRSFPRIAQGRGLHLVLEGGRKIVDASGGAAVACIGHGNTRVHEAMQKQLAKVSYCSTTFFTTDVCEELCHFLVDSTGGRMARAYIVNSGKWEKTRRFPVGQDS